MNRLQTRVENLERKIDLYGNNLNHLSDEELEGRLRRLYEKEGIDPALPIDEMMRISKNKRNRE